MNIVLQEVSSGDAYRISLPCVIGRGKEADLSLSDLSISHCHAVISEMNNQIWVDDLGSANGITVNDERVRERTLLREGDSLHMGRTTFIVSQSQSAGAEKKQTLILHTLPMESEQMLDHKRLKMIYDMTALLSENQEIAGIGERIFARFKDIFNHDRGYIALFQSDGSLKPVYPDSAACSVPLSRGIQDRLFQNGESLLLEDALGDPSMSGSESIVALRIRSALCAPLIYHDQIYGLIYLDRDVPGAYNKDDVEFLRSIAFILAPMIENARLWSELKVRYSSAMEDLRIAEARLINMERTAAYVRLAHAMAHEIRNPLMIIGGVVRRIVQSKTERAEDPHFQAIMMSVERIECVLKEVDSLIRIPAPQKKLGKIDILLQEEINAREKEWREKDIRPQIILNTAYLMIPLDVTLIRKAISMVFKELLFSYAHHSDLIITIGDAVNDIEIRFGQVNGDERYCEIFDSALEGRPWSLSLFLNIASKIISDHEGKLIVTSSGHSLFPIIIRLPRMRMETVNSPGIA